MSDLTDLLERAVSDLQQGWPEAAVDALGRAIRAERRLGEMLAEQKRTVGLNEGGRPKKTPANEEGVSAPTLKEVGIDWKLSARAQKLAAVPERPAIAARASSEGSRWEAVEQRLSGLEERHGRVLEEIAKIVSEVDSRLRALEERGAKPSALQELNAFRSSDSRRLDDEIKRILAMTPGRWPKAKEVHRLLLRAAVHPMRELSTVRRHLLRIRGKRSHTVEAKTEASAPRAPAIISP